MRVVVSILNWNNSAATNECLAGIVAIARDRQPDVVVVDNHSLREPLEIKTALNKQLRSLKRFDNEVNLGFGGGHNKVIRYAAENGYDYIVLLNNDSEIIDKDVFDKLTAALENDPEALAANPMILSAADPDIVWYGGGRLSLMSGRAAHLSVGAKAAGLTQAVQTVSLLTGGCMAIALKRAGMETMMFSEDYFLYWEDTDWSARAVKAGYKLLYVPRARLLHKVSSSLGIRSPAYIYYNIRNQYIFIRKNVSPPFRPAAWLGVGVIIARYKFNIIFRYRSGRLTALKALWAGWRDGWLGRTGRMRSDNG